MAASLLRTKLNPPPQRRGMVARPRLLDKLEQGLAEGHRLILLSAPAGYGKSTLLSAWLAHHREHAAWLSLDEQDNDPVLFWRGVVAGLQVVWPGIGQAVLSALQSPQPPALKLVVLDLLNEIEPLSGPVILVLDDYAQISAPAIHESVSFALERLPRVMHVVISTRSDPPLPVARWRARAEMTEMRAAELRFDTHDAETFLHQGMDLRLAADDIASLEARTEGWIAGLQMAALSLQGHDAEGVHRFISAFSGSHRYVIDFLAEEVLNQQADDVRSFVLHVSILDRLNAPLCNALTGRNDGQTMLELLEQRNLFLVPLDDERRWYRFHRLFADVLRACLAQALPDQPAVLHGRAAAWFVQNGYVSEAIVHYVAAGDRHAAADVVEQRGMETIVRGEFVTLAGWLNALEAAARERPSWAF